jgi:RNA polymerase sigma-70 factor (ECF subfamily)
MFALDERTYELHYASIVRFLTGFGVGDAEDLAQETFLRFARANVAIPPERTRFWLFRVARNIALNEIRRRRIRERGSVVDAPRQDESVETTLAAREDLARCLTMLQSLPEEWRATIILRDVEELSYAEIATTLGVEVSKVKSDLFRARTRLREQLGRRR